MQMDFVRGWGIEGEVKGRRTRESALCTLPSASVQRHLAAPPCPLPGSRAMPSTLDLQRSCAPASRQAATSLSRTC